MASPDIAALVDQLGSEDAIARQKARFALVRAGQEAADALTAALGDAREQVRWEAAKALAKVPAPAAAEALAGMLGEEDAGNRWVAAEALLQLGRDGVRAALQAALGDTSIPMRLGVHHVLHDTSDPELRELVRPVWEAMEGPGAAEATPVAALAALRELGALEA